MTSRSPTWHSVLTAYGLSLGNSPCTTALDPMETLTTDRSGAMQSLLFAG
jgi:hypothetical protein